MARNVCVTPGNPYHMSRHEIVDWVNDTLSCEIKTIGDLGQGPVRTTSMVLFRFVPVPKPSKIRKGNSVALSKLIQKHNKTIQANRKAKYHLINPHTIIDNVSSHLD